MNRAQYLQFLKDLKTGLQFSLADHAEQTGQWLDGQIARESMDPGAEETKRIAEVWDGLRKAALAGTTFTYPAHAESTTGIAGETVDARAEVSKIYITRIQNFARPMSWAIDFFETVNLAENEVPFYQNETQHAVRVALVGEDGGCRNRHIIKSQEQTQVQLYVLASERVKWKLMDILRGNVADENSKLVDIAADLALELDDRLGTALRSNTTIANFNFSTGNKATRTLHLHPSIDVANLPTTNALSGLTGENGVNKAVLDAAFKYCAYFGGVFPDGDIYPVAVYYPSSFGLSILGDVTVTTQGNSLRDQVVTRGFIDEYLGRKIVYRPQASLAASGKKVYFRTNKPVGKLYRKPSMDKVIRTQNDELNEGTARATLVWGSAIPDQCRPNIIAAQVKA